MRELTIDEASSRRAFLSTMGRALSVRPGWKKNTIGTKLMQVLKTHWPGLKMVHSQPTDQGRKFLKKTGDYQPGQDKEAKITGPVTVETPTDEALISSLLLTLLEGDDSDEAWIGVDFDGTLAKHTKWKGSTHCGEPVPKMVSRVRRWVGHGEKVRIFTARADDEKSVNAIKKWLKKHKLPDLPITNLKDRHMKEFWDDKAVAVKKNTGEVKESANPPFLVENFLLEADEAWEPSPHVIAWFQNMLRMMAPDGVWTVPDTGQIYQFDKANHTATLIHGDPNDPDGWHAKTKQVLQQLGYTVHDSTEPPGGPDERAFAESEQPSDYEEWEPHPYALNSMQHLLMQMYITGQRVLETGETGHAYKIDFENNQAALIEGSPKDPEHDKMKKILSMLGFTVHDYPPIPPTPDEISFSESRLNESPDIQTIKKKGRPLSPEEKAQLPKNLPAGDYASTTKAVIDGQTWYACYTHRAGQVRKTFKELLKVYPKIASTA